jgi:hypothetical protein
MMVFVESMLIMFFVCVCACVRACGRRRTRAHEISSVKKCENRFFTAVCKESVCILEK